MLYTHFFKMLQKNLKSTNSKCFKNVLCYLGTLI